MFNWINETLNEWDSDPKIIWKASVQHHPLFGKWYNDFQHITRDYLPILMDHRFDLYLNGHEHDLEYAFYPYSQAPSDYWFKFQQLKDEPEDFQCLNNVEELFGGSSRSIKFKQGDALHQVTTGTTGFDLYPLCLARPSMGRWMYA